MNPEIVNTDVSALIRHWHNDKFIAPELVKHGLWSQVWRLSTTKGVAYLKVTPPGSTHEIEVAKLLNEIAPETGPELISCDVLHGWMLSRDGGQSLRSYIRRSKDFSLWAPVLHAYADLQQRVADHMPHLLLHGVPDRRLHALPGLYDALLQDTRWLRIDCEPGLSRDEHARLQDARGRVRALCELLATFGIPESLNHGDLGDANVLQGDARPLFFDWGDAVISHPFFSLRTTLVSLYFSLGLDTGALELNEVCNMYLACWRRYGSPNQLRPALRIALALAPINGALTWRAALMRHDEAALADYIHIVPALLREFLSLADAAPGAPAW